MLTPFPEKSLDQRIRDEFERVGGSVATAPFVHHCHDAGIWSDDEWESLAFREAQSAVRRALHAPDNQGLPFAGQTAETHGNDVGHVWKQRRLWLYPDYETNISDLRRQRDSCHRTAVALADECHARFGRAPDVGFPSDAAQAAD